MTKIIVGVDASAGANDAICLASRLADITGAQLMLVNVFPYDQHPSRAVNTAFEQYLRQDSTELLEALRSRLGDETVAVRAVPNPSSAHGLDTVAEHEDADLIVVGSTHTGRTGRVLPGSTAERLLHGAPCPVAVAAKGYADHGAKAPTTIGCGFDGSPSSQRALEAAGGLAAATGAPLRGIRASRPAGSDIAAWGVPFGGIAAYNDDLGDRAHDELHAAVGELG